MDETYVNTDGRDLPLRLQLTHRAAGSVVSPSPGVIALLRRDRPQGGCKKSTSGHASCSDVRFLGGTFIPEEVGVDSIWSLLLENGVFKRGRRHVSPPPIATPPLPAPPTPCGMPCPDHGALC